MQISMIDKCLLYTREKIGSKAAAADMSNMHKPATPSSAAHR